MLVGRESEQQLVDRLLAGARIGNGGVLAVTGEAGVGKTALLEHARARPHGFRLMTATGTEPEREIPFAGLLSLLRPALSQLDDIPGPQAESLSAALALSRGSAGDRFAIGAATLSLLCRYAEGSPVAVFVDDLQLLDRPSAEALVFAARRVGADPIAILLAARTGESDDVLAGLPTLELPGLDRGAARDLLGSTPAGPVTDDQLDRLHRATAGNPLAMLELGSDLGVLDHTWPDVPLPVPATVAESFGKRVRLLDPGARATLLVAVVSDGDLALTSAACGRLGLDPALLGAARESGLVSLREREIGFRHPLVRAAVYAAATLDERRSAHRAVADALPEQDRDRRAWHLSEAVWAPDASVAALLTGAAEHAAERAGYAVASTAFERAARLSPDFDSRVDRLVKAAETAWEAGLGRRAIGLLDGLGELPVPTTTLTTTLRLRAAIAAGTGSLVEARDMLERAATLTDSADREVVLLADAVHATLYLADTEGSLRLADKLAGALDRAGSAEARSLGMMGVGMAKILAGRAGADELRTAVSLLTDSPEVPADPLRHSWLMIAPLFLREASTGAGLRASVAEVRGRAGVGTLPRLLFHVARDQATTDAWSRAEANYSEAIRLARETGQSTELAASLAGLAWLQSRQGRADACRASAAEAMTICAARSVHLGTVWVLFALGDLELAVGDPLAAVDRLLQLESLLGELGLRDPDVSPRPELVDALLRLGRVEEARRLAADHLSAAEAKGQPWACARGQRAMGLLASGDELDRRFGHALELHEHTLDSFETGRTQLAYGALLRRAGRRVDARPQLRGALAVFADLGAATWAEQAAVELEATGEKVPRREQGGVAALTPQELQVSLLLSEGRTTREAAAALFLSPKTVEYHLRKVYAKLGIRSRSELADLLPR